ncbi:nitrilase family protein [Niabella terrae]
MKDKLTLSLIQADLVWEDKAANLEMFQQQIEQIQEPGQIVILPEMFSTGFSMRAAELAETMDGPTVTWMRDLSAYKKVVLTGSLIIREEDAAGHMQFYNRLIWMLPNGQYGIYNKRHLFTLAREQDYYTPGQKRLFASVNEWKINLQVCYDLRFPVWARQIPRMTGENWRGLYDLLIYVANWPEKRSTAWKTLLQARAIENQCYVVGVNRVGTDGNGIYHGGDSMVVDPQGAILYQQHGKADTATLTLEKSVLEQTREQLPFWEDADEFKVF